ncbi:hypothetical protein L3C95_04480 [Chitinophaga filiformis]|uniref:hypothetical protein n=1 Tax=Chitinophaga filiformis TaxID=104663 RepID=UPI001F47741D|nr:hypothetical protein [Chitinophaga filiformis]MCF6402117.1 hypothetical protein [Chitinophaga filiformis]
MKKISIKNTSLGLILIAASAVIAAVVPDTLSGKRVNSETLRAFGDTSSGADQDAGQPVISCWPEVEAVMSCTATAATDTTTGFFAVKSSHPIGGFDYQTQGNTSLTAGQAGDQKSISVLVS